MAWWDDTFKAVANTASAAVSAVGSGMVSAVKVVADTSKAVANFVAPVGNVALGVASAVANNPTIATATMLAGNAAGAFLGMPMAGTLLVAGAKAIDEGAKALRPVADVVKDVQNVASQASAAASSVAGASASVVNNIVFTPSVSAGGNQAVDLAKRGTIPVNLGQFYGTGGGSIQLQSFDGNAWRFLSFQRVG